MQNVLDFSSEDIKLFKQIKEPDDIENMKYEECVSFKFSFQIKKYRVNKRAIAEYEVVNNGSKKVVMPNITQIEFIGEKDKSNLIISNDLIYGEFNVTPRKGKKYLYIYLDGRVDHYKIDNNVWLSKKVLDEILIDNPNFKILKDKNLELVSESFRLSI